MFLRSTILKRNIHVLFSQHKNLALEFVLIKFSPVECWLGCWIPSWQEITCGRLVLLYQQFLTGNLKVNLTQSSLALSVVLVVGICLKNSPSEKSSQCYMLCCMVIYVSVVLKCECEFELSAFTHILLFLGRTVESE